MKSFNKTDLNLLVNLFQDGDNHAFARIFNEFHGPLVFFSRRMLPVQSRDYGEEIVQDVFVKLHERRLFFSSIEQIKAFLYISTKNACFNRIAKEKTAQRKLGGYLMHFSEVDESSVLRSMIHSETLRELRNAMDLLPPQCRDIMKRLLDEDHKDSNDIAAEMGISASTVRNQKARGIAILQKRLKISRRLLSLLGIF